MWRLPLLEVSIWAAGCRWQAITGRLLLCVCLCPSLSGDGVQQRHGNSLAGLLESCYQVPDLPEISFLHTRSGLKHKKEENSASPSPHQTPRGNEEDRTAAAWNELSQIHLIKDIRYAKSRERSASSKEMSWESCQLYFYISGPLIHTELVLKNKKAQQWIRRGKRNSIYNCCKNHCWRMENMLKGFKS